MILQDFPEKSESGRRLAISIRDYAELLPNCYEDEQDAQHAVSIFRAWLDIQLDAAPVQPVTVTPTSMIERLIKRIVEFFTKIDTVKALETLKRNFLQPVDVVTITRLGHDDTRIDPPIIRLEHDKTRLGDTDHDHDHD
jgi:hypothetical protein